MSSPKSVNQKSLERNTNPSPVKDFDKSYDSRESVNDQDLQRANTTPKQTTKNLKYEQSVPQNTEEPLFENTEELQKNQTANPVEVKDNKEKKKKKIVKKTEENSEDLGSDGTATFPKVSSERRARLTEDNETNQGEVVTSANLTDNASAEAKLKQKKKKATENTKDVTQTTDTIQEEKPKKTKKKIVEKKEEEAEPNVQVVEEKKVENPVANTQQKPKLAKKTQKAEEPVVVEPPVQKSSKNVLKNEKPQEIALNIVTETKQKINKQEPENKRPQSKQEGRGNRNLQVDPAATKSPLINALVSPANLAGKMNMSTQNNLSVTPKANETEPRYSRNTQKDDDFGPWGSKEKSTANVRAQSSNPQAGNNTLKKSPTQGELSTVSSPKSKLGPIRSKIQTGLDNIRASSKKGDTSEIIAVTPVASTNNRGKSPGRATKQRETTVGQRSYGDVTGTHKSYILERVSNHSELKKKKKEGPRMRSFDAGKTDKISAEDTFETRSKVWQIRKAEKQLEEEKKRSRKELEQCTFNPTVNKKTLPSELNTSNIYERSVEWSDKVKSALVAKAEEMLETAKKPDPKKPRMKSFTGSCNDIRTSKVVIEGFTGPQFGVPKTINVPAFSQEPLEFRGNLEEKVGEICSMYENVTSALKMKSAKNASKSFIKEKPITRNESVKSASRVSTANNKERSVKVEPVIVSSPSDNKRIASLRGILNIGSKEKKSPNVVAQGQFQKNQEGELISEVDSTSRIVTKPNQRMEIRNNRYVIVDDDAEISAIEKKENDSNYEVSVNFDVSTVTAQ